MVAELDRGYINTEGLSKVRPGFGESSTFSLFRLRRYWDDFGFRLDVISLYHLGEDASFGDFIRAMRHIPETRKEFYGNLKPAGQPIKDA